MIGRQSHSWTAPGQEIHVLTRPISRVPLRKQLGQEVDGDELRQIKGDLIVWWYGPFKKNSFAPTAPLVEVLLRRLDHADNLGGFVMVSIAVGRLGRFPIGTIWRNGRCIAEAEYERQEFHKLDFTLGAWSYTSRSSTYEHGLRSFPDGVHRR